MRVVHTIAEMREILKGERLKAKTSIVTATVGLVPTMGYLHEGHLSLIARAREECDVIVMSIFVNPLQFGPGEDFDKYPRDEEHDLRLAEKAGVDYVFMPTLQDMYPNPTKTTVIVKDVTDVLCGASRPGHFEGVATVVTKLFNIVQPDRAFFGMKDAQQVAVIEQMTADLNIPVCIVRCPTLRESDGLAMSSRNVYLSPEERNQAPVLNQALQEAEGWVKEPGMNPEELIRRIRSRLEQSPLGVIDYVEVLTYPGLVHVRSSEDFNGEKSILVALAVKFGKARLIDNRILFANGGETTCS